MSVDAPAAQHPVGAIEVAEGPVDDSEFEPIEWDASSADSASLTSSIHSHQFEFGRRYHNYRHGRYPLPNDEREANREDMKHAMMLELTDGKLFYSPIGENPHKIIDVGTGTVADAFPAAEILGIDLSPMQPTWIPPNVKFLVDDAEDDWISGDDFDFVHLRYMISFLKNIDKFIGQAYKHHLEGAGFKEIRCEVKKVPIGTWAKDEILRLCGLYLKNAIKDVLPAMQKPFEANGLSPVETEVWNAIARKEIEDNSKHRYFNFYFWHAQKPENAPERDGGSDSSGGEEA
ncbi:Secondary metabolism regulator LAE1 [Colletotrichum sp. SAR11_240]|nr:Secondary metabolism regulator LAE1 [Colletotrichum sp. SAR11_240]